MKLQDIHIRDPFVLADGGRYYLYGSRCAAGAGSGSFAVPGTGLDVYVSDRLDEWSPAHECFTRPLGFWADRDFWAPEVHRWQGAYYMFVSFKAEGRCRGTQILRAESPLGPFLPISEGPVTPPEWECLDGTLYVDEDGTPWIVFCHEWVQVGNGTICARPLTADLRAPAGEPVQLFSAHDPAWVRSFSDQVEGYVTDGPFLWRTADGHLRMLWSSFAAPGCYAQAVACSESGRITGPWRHAPQPLFARDGGHGMLFRAYDGQLYLALHRPNNRPYERPCLLPVTETPDGFALLEPAHG